MENSYPIIDLTVIYPRFDKRFAVDHDFPKGPEMDGVRGVITEIVRRSDIDGWAEFDIHILNDGISRVWTTVASQQFIIKYNIKENVQ